MSTFTVIAIIFTLLLFVYYGIMIALDVRRLGKKPSSGKEEFDVSSMQEQDESFSVDETKFKLPDSEVQETGHEQQPESQEQEEFFEAVKPSIDKPTYKPKAVVAVEEKMEAVEVTTSQEQDIDEFYDTVTQGDWMGGKFKNPTRNPESKV